MSHLKTAIRAIGRPITMVFCGLDYAGKTAMYIRLKTGKFDADLKPTFSSTMDTVTFEERGLANVTIIDLGGQKSLRNQWNIFVEKSDAVLYVIDAHDLERYPEAKKEFQDRVIPLLDERLCIIVCNKFDLFIIDDNTNKSKLLADIEERIKNILQIPEGSNYAVVTTSQKTGLGLPKVTRIIREKLANK
ncbi:MAG: ADP-ribosylation factor-like protein [Candidatus Hodarchaeales archaeon]